MLRDGVELGLDFALPEGLMPPSKDVPYKDEALRLEQACDGNSNVPPLNRGRYIWFKRELSDKFGISISTEGVRRWFSGESHPSRDNIKALAELLGVDEGWLSLGHVPQMDARSKKARDATVDGMVNTVAGFIQMHFMSVAFPDKLDPKANPAVDIFSISRGRQYAFHVATAQPEGNKWRFVIPTGATDTFILGAVAIGDFCIEVIEIDAEGLEAAGARKGAYIALEVSKTYKSGDHQFKVIRSFRDPL